MSQQKNNLVLWYDKPAKDWNEALPVGNGRIGAMIFGGPKEDLIQLNEETLWTGGPADLNPNPAASDYLQPVRDALFRDSISEAVKLLQKMQGPDTQMYQPLGDIIIRQVFSGEPTEYRRQLDISTAGEICSLHTKEKISVKGTVMTQTVTVWNGRTEYVTSFPTVSNTIYEITAESPANSFKFDFGTKQGYTHIKPGQVYTAETGYGFDYGSSVTVKDDYITSDKPIYFSVKLPEGNYNVKVTVGDRNGESTTTIKAECRRLMVEKLQTKKGQLTTAEFTVHIRDSVIRTGGSNIRLKPREINYLHWDDKLTLEFNNSAPKISAIEITPANTVPTMFLAGNSTVVDQADEPWASWGQMIPAFFHPGKIAIANYAESGETLKAFKGERRLEKIWSMAKPGDYLFIEFAHNDQKPGGNHLDAFTTYKETLKEWIREAKERGMTPVLVTSTNRRSFDSTGHIINTLLDYPEAMRQTGKETNVAVIDLNAMSKTLYEALGPEKSIKVFVHYPAHTFPGQETEFKDNTHFSTYGAYELAKCVVKGIKESNLHIAKYLRTDLKQFDPAYPDPVEQWDLPMSTFINIKKPDGN